MANKFKPGEVKTVSIISPFGEPRTLSVTIVSEETPAMYRCSTNDGYAILVKEDDLG